MLRIWMLTALAALLPAAIAAELVPAQAVQVTRATFAKGVRDRGPVDEVSGTANLTPGQELYFWMEFQGGPDALGVLEATNQLSMVHEWRRGLIVTDAIVVGITAQRWLAERERIRESVRSRGFFTWRTYSFKGNWTGGAYEVLVREHTNRAVRRVGSSSEFRPSIVISMEGR